METNHLNTEIILRRSINIQSTGLLQYSYYHFNIYSTDVFGNSNESANFKFLTLDKISPEKPTFNAKNEEIPHKLLLEKIPTPKMDAIWEV